MAGRVRVDPPVGPRAELVRPLQHGRAEGERPLLLCVEVVHVEVQVQLLRALLAGPYGRLVTVHPLAGQRPPPRTRPPRPSRAPRGPRSPGHRAVPRRTRRAVPDQRSPARPPAAFGSPRTPLALRPLPRRPAYGRGRTRHRGRHARRHAVPPPGFASKGRRQRDPPSMPGTASGTAVRRPDEPGDRHDRSPDTVRSGTGGPCPHPPAGGNTDRPQHCHGPALRSAPEGCRIRTRTGRATERRSRCRSR